MPFIKQCSTTPSIWTHHTDETPSQATWSGHHV